MVDDDNCGFHVRLTSNCVPAPGRSGVQFAGQIRRGAFPPQGAHAWVHKLVHQPVDQLRHRLLLFVGKVRAGTEQPPQLHLAQVACIAIHLLNQRIEFRGFQPALKVGHLFVENLLA